MTYVHHGDWLGEYAIAASHPHPQQVHAAGTLQLDAAAGLQVRHGTAGKLNSARCSVRLSCETDTSGRSTPVTWKRREQA